MLRFCLAFTLLVGWTLVVGMIVERTSYSRYPGAFGPPHVIDHPSATRILALGILAAGVVLLSGLARRRPSDRPKLSSGIVVGTCCVTAVVAGLSFLDGLPGGRVSDRMPDDNGAMARLRDEVRKAILSDHLEEAGLLIERASDDPRAGRTTAETPDTLDRMRATVDYLEELKARANAAADEPKRRLRSPEARPE